MVPEQFHQGPAVLHVDAMPDAIHDQADRGSGRCDQRRSGGIRRCAPQGRYRGPGATLISGRIGALVANAAGVGRVVHGVAPAWKRSCYGELAQDYSGWWRGHATAFTVLRLACAVGMRYNGGHTSWTHTQGE